jgi:hypothetical protein
MFGSGAPVGMVVPLTSTGEYRSSSLRVADLASAGGVFAGVCGDVIIL